MRPPAEWDRKRILYHRGGDRGGPFYALSLRRRIGPGDFDFPWHRGASLHAGEEFVLGKRDVRAVFEHGLGEALVRLSVNV
jgi:hypothetical protein